MPAGLTLSWFAFLRIEADVAMTFISVAKNYSKPEDSTRAIGNARKALEQIRGALLNHIRFSPDEIVSLELRCTEIESALKAFRRAPND